MRNTDDSGPAFPLHPDNPTGEAEGMSLRDWFAGQALPALVGRLKSIGEQGSKVIALAAYDLADAMLAARQK